MYLIVTNNQLCLGKYGAQIKMEYLEDGILVRCVVDDKLYAKIKNYIVEE